MSWLLNNPIEDETVRQHAEMFEKQSQERTLTISSKFEIASVLVRSNSDDYIRKGINILEHLCTSVENNAIRSRYLIYLSIGYFRIKEFDLAKNCTDRLLIIDPGNRQGMELGDLIREKLYDYDSPY